MKRSKNLQFAICNLQFAILIVSIGLILLLHFLLPVIAQAQSGRSLDGELLKNLKAQSKSDIEREVFGPDEKKDKLQTGAGQGGPDLNQRLQRELGFAAEKENDNPLLNIAQSMFQVRQRMAQSDAGPATLNLQKQIVADLDLLIDQARKSCGQCSSSSSNPQQSAQKPGGSPPKPGAKAGQKLGNKPSGASLSRSPDGQTPKPDMEEMRLIINNLWGELPPRVREQMLQTPMEDFIPKYQDLIEDYFRDLSNEKKTGE
ncbi:MAG: hypothetical protein ABSE63_17495 [Thermoguttaceae bacterium]|jgi:hypothetical protein